MKLKRFISFAASALIAIAASAQQYKYICVTDIEVNDGVPSKHMVESIKNTLKKTGLEVITTAEARQLGTAYKALTLKVEIDIETMMGVATETECEVENYATDAKLYKTKKRVVGTSETKIYSSLDKALQDIVKWIKKNPEPVVY